MTTQRTVRCYGVATVLAATCMVLAAQGGAQAAEAKKAPAGASVDIPVSVAGQ